MMAQAGQTVKHYQFENGMFTENGFIDAINKNIKI